MESYNIKVKSNNVFLAVDIQKIRRTMLSKGYCVIDFFEKDYTEVLFAIKKTDVASVTMLRHLEKEVGEYNYVLSLQNDVGIEDFDL